MAACCSIAMAFQAEGLSFLLRQGILCFCCASLADSCTVHLQDFKHEHEQAIGQLQQQLSSAKHGLSERDEIIQRFKQVSAADAMPSIPTGMYENQPLNTMSPAQNGSSPVQAYSKYVALSHEHNKLKREHAKLHAEWEQVGLEMF